MELSVEEFPFLCICNFACIYVCTPLVWLMPPCLAPIWKPEESVKSSGIEGIVGLVLEIEYGFFQRAASASNVLKISLAPGTCF